MTNARKTEVSALTGVRGVAAILVLTYHFFSPFMSQGSVTFKLFGRGYLNVDLFFMLSGFVMALNYGGMFGGGLRWQATRLFLWKRFARVYPLYFCVLFALTFGQWAAYGDFINHHSWISTQLPHPWLDIPLNVLLVQSWGFATGVVAQAWSISTEAAAYMMFPLLSLVILRARPPLLMAVMAVVGLLVGIAVWIASTEGVHRAGAMDIWDGPPALLRCLGGFVLGMALFRITAWPQLRAAFTDMFGFAVIGVYVFLELEEAPDLALYSLLALLILCLAGNKGRLARAFGSGPVFWLGVVSYAVYLLHPYFARPMYVLEGLLAARLPVWLALAVSSSLTMTAVLGAAAAAYLFIEKPARRVLGCVGGQRGRAWTPSREPGPLGIVGEAF
jgi:peptidoglycan/LPS O-acetylase OafA/YrhL